jgi:hypothetical protein
VGRQILGIRRRPLPGSRVPGGEAWPPLKSMWMLMSLWAPAAELVGATVPETVIAWAEAGIASRRGRQPATRLASVACAPWRRSRYWKVASCQVPGAHTPIVSNTAPACDPLRSTCPNTEPRRYGSTGSGQLKSFGASRIRITFAGTPPATAFAGMSLVTTALVPTIELSPTRTPRRKQAL